MNLVALVPLIVSLVGLVVYLVASKPEAKEIGRLAYFAGLLVFLFFVAGHTVSLHV